MLETNVVIQAAADMTAIDKIGRKKKEFWIIIAVREAGFQTVWNLTGNLLATKVHLPPVILQTC